MKVKKRIEISDNHSIEWGEATWNDKYNTNDKSIRNRYNTGSGKYNWVGSSQIPWEDFKTMISKSVKEGEFTNSELSDILSDISDKLKTL